MNSGYYIAEVRSDSSPGEPIGNEDGAIMVFEDLNEDLWNIVSRLSTECEKELGLYKLHIELIGRVHRT